MLTNQEQYERGRALLEKIHGGHAGEALVAAQREICPDFAAMSIEWAMGGIMAVRLLVPLEPRASPA
jgi:4-carboxymuconolactone decarboxylase